LKVDWDASRVGRVRGAGRVVGGPLTFKLDFEEVEGIEDGDGFNVWEVVVDAWRVCFRDEFELEGRQKQRYCCLEVESLKEKEILEWIYREGQVVRRLRKVMVLIALGAIGGIYTKD
jgi:hypothetical protein